VNDVPPAGMRVVSIWYFRLQFGHAMTIKPSPWGMDVICTPSPPPMGKRIGRVLLANPAGRR
jgi:hypothetical protein